MRNGGIVLVLVQKKNIYFQENLQKYCNHLFLVNYAPNPLLAGALPQTSLGELTALSQTP